MKPDQIENVEQIDHEVLIFSTSISSSVQAEFVCETLLKNQDIYKVTVDTEDWEKILRIECASTISNQKIKEVVDELGFRCTELE